MDTSDLQNFNQISRNGHRLQLHDHTHPPPAPLSTFCFFARETFLFMQQPDEEENTNRPS